MVDPSATLRSAVGRLRRDRYTGSNRCWPCTGLNLLILAALAAGAWLTLGAAVGVGTLVVGLAAVWLRGYLVPLTPRVTPPLLAALPTSWSPHAAPPEPEAGPRSRVPPADDGDGDSRAGDGPGRGVGADAAARTESTDGVDGHADADATLLGRLFEAGVLTEDDRGVGLAPSFAAAWRSRAAAARPVTPDGVATALVEELPWVADATAVVDEGHRWIRLDGQAGAAVAESWLSLPAAVADLTAVRTLADRTSLTDRERTLAASSLRPFLEACPACGASLVTTDPTNCCGSPRGAHGVVEQVLACPDCDESLAVLSGQDPPDRDSA
jgi:hypothetical protein